MENMKEIFLIMVLGNLETVTTSFEHLENNKPEWAEEDQIDKMVLYAECYGIVIMDHEAKEKHSKTLFAPYPILVNKANPEIYNLSLAELKKVVNLMIMDMEQPLDFEEAEYASQKQEIQKQQKDTGEETNEGINQNFRRKSA